MRTNKDIQATTERMLALLDRMDQCAALTDEELHLLGGALRFFFTPKQAREELAQRPKAAERILKGLGNPDWQLIRADLFNIATEALTTARKVSP